MNTKKKIVTFTASALAVVMASTIALSEPVQSSSLGIDAAKDATVQVEKKNVADEVVPEKDIDAVYGLVKSGVKEAKKELPKKVDNGNAVISNEKAAPAKVDVKEVKEVPADNDIKLTGEAKAVRTQEISLPGSKIQEALDSGEPVQVQTADGVVETDLGTKSGFEIVLRDDGKYEIVYRYTVGGKLNEISTDLLYDPIENTLNGDGERGLLNLGFDLDLDQVVFYSTLHPWQKMTGYCELYDIAAPLIGCHIDTVRFKFEYAGMDWMIQPWKGQYGITSGAELGAYHKPKYRVAEFYDCISDEELMPMGFEVYKNYGTGKYNLLFTRPIVPHWWSTGFKVGEVTSYRNLMVDYHIVVPNDMLAPFTASMEKQGFVRGNNYVVNDYNENGHTGKKVTFRF